MVNKIKEREIEPVSYRKFLKFKLELEKNRSIINNNGEYRFVNEEDKINEEKRYQIKSNSTRLESLEILSSPFLGQVKLYISNDSSSFGITRTKSYITSKINSSNDVWILRLDEHKVVYPHKDPRLFKYVVFVSMENKLTEIYLSNATTTNYSGTGDRFHNSMEKFIEDNQLDLFIESVGNVDDGKDVRDNIMRYLVINGYM